MKSNDFNRIAFAYDRLARLVFGKSIVESQKHFLNKIQDHSKVLILGGGSGWIVPHLFEVAPTAEVYYIESSLNMIKLAERRCKDDKRVHFIHGTENDIPPLQFDAVITNFYLDLFQDESLKRVVHLIKEKLAMKAIWVATDFKEEKWWNKALLKLMYAFFRFTSSIEAGKLPDWNVAMLETGARKIDSKFFYGGFMESAVFQF